MPKPAGITTSNGPPGTFTHCESAVSPRSCLLGDELRRRVEDGLDVVPVRIEDERGVVVAAVLGTHTRGSDVCPAMADGNVVPAHDRAGVACAEGDVRAGGHPVAAGLAADRVQAEIITVGAPEQDVGVTLELAFRQGHESEFRQ